MIPLKKLDTILAKRDSVTNNPACKGFILNSSMKTGIKARFIKSKT
jgi:hypothetical protein